MFHTRPDLPWGSPNLLYHGHWLSFQVIQRPERGVNHPHTSRLKKEYSHTSTPCQGLRGLFYGNIFNVFIVVSFRLLEFPGLVPNRTHHTLGPTSIN